MCNDVFYLPVMMFFTYCAVMVAAAGLNCSDHLSELSTFFFELSLTGDSEMALDSEMTHFV